LSIVDVILLADHQTRVVVGGAAMLGLTGGVVGVFALLRKRALLADALAHATLPGVAAAFLLVSWMGGNGKRLPFLLAGAVVAALAAAAVVTGLRRYTRLKEDAILGVVLSVFFGAGVVLLSVIRKHPHGSAAGLEGFIFGKAASMTGADVMLIAGSAALVLLVVLVMFKELRLLCFDAEFSTSQGYSPRVLDALLMLLVIVVSVIGLQAVGLVLVIALLVIPAAAARLCTHRLSRMVALAGGFGAISGWVGSSASGMSKSLPSGASIVIAAASIFFVCLLTGPAQGVIPRRLRRRVDLSKHAPVEGAAP
jgi:manganese/zinc/iron transport system permease protein